MAEWISVKDELPDLGRYVLTCTYDGSMYVLELLESFGMTFWEDENCACYKMDFIDYWMPLPEPPKEE